MKRPRPARSAAPPSRHRFLGWCVAAGGALVLCLAGGACNTIWGIDALEYEEPSTDTSTGAGGAGGSGGGPGGSGEAGSGGLVSCQPGTTQPCYTGPADTAGVGTCQAGTETCLPSGQGYGPCDGEVTPQVDEQVTAVAAAGIQATEGMVRAVGEPMAWALSAGILGAIRELCREIPDPSITAAGARLEPAQVADPKRTPQVLVVEAKLEIPKLPGAVDPGESPEMAPPPSPEGGEPAAPTVERQVAFEVWPNRDGKGAQLRLQIGGWILCGVSGVEPRIAGHPPSALLLDELAAAPPPHLDDSGELPLLFTAQLSARAVWQLFGADRIELIYETGHTVTLHFAASAALLETILPRPASSPTAGAPASP